LIRKAGAAFLIFIAFLALAETAYRNALVVPSLSQLIFEQPSFVEDMRKLANSSEFSYYNLGRAFEFDCEDQPFGCYNAQEFDNVGLIIAQIPVEIGAAQKYGIVVPDCENKQEQCWFIQRVSSGILGIEYVEAENYLQDIDTDEFGNSDPNSVKKCTDLTVGHFYTAALCRGEIKFGGQITDIEYSILLTHGVIEGLFTDSPNPPVLKIYISFVRGRAASVPDGILGDTYGNYTN
jgi:hypothetical protein